MGDLHNGRELSRLMKLKSKSKNANPAFAKVIDSQIDALHRKIALRFLEVFGEKHQIIENIEKSFLKQNSKNNSKVSQ